MGLVVNKVPIDSGGESIKSQLVETITGDKFNTFMSSSGMSLRWNLFLLRLQQFRQGRHRGEDR